MDFKHFVKPSQFLNKSYVTMYIPFNTRLKIAFYNKQSYT